MATERGPGNWPVDPEAAFVECRQKLDSARKEADHWRDNHKTLKSAVEKMRSSHLAARDAYLAMYYFIRAYWERGGRRDGSVTLLLQGIGPAHDPDDPEVLRTDDPAFWDDWLAAIKRARAEGVPGQL